MTTIARKRLGVFSLCIAVAVLLDSVGAAQPAPNYPVVVRISESSFNQDPAPIAEQSPVDLCVLGVRSRGTATVRGTLQVDLTSSHRKAALGLVFAGQSESTTTAREQSAVVRTVTTCTFRCRTQVDFDEVRGFTAGETTVEVDIANMRRRISSTSPGLRGRIVRNVAQQRIQENSGHIRSVALREAKSRLATSMAKRVEERLAAWNEHWGKLVAALRSQRWYVDMPKPFFASSNHELIIIFAADPALVTRAYHHCVQAESLPRFQVGD